MKSSIAPAWLPAVLLSLALAPAAFGQSTPAITQPATGPSAPSLADDSRQVIQRELSPAAAGSERGQAALQARAIESVQSLLVAKRYAEALRVAERALRDFPDNTQLRFQRAVALADSDQRDEAISAFSALTRDHPELAEPYNNLAVLHAASGNLRAARDALEAAVAAVPDYALAQENLGDLYMRMAVDAYEGSTKLPGTTAAARRKLVLARGLLEQILPSGAR